MKFFPEQYKPKYFVEVVSDSDLKVVSRIQCGSLKKADKTENGVLINIDAEKYSTRIVDEDGKEVHA